MARLLLADDDKHLGRILARTLTAAGHEVLVALDGPAALALARSERPELIVLDVALPGMSGDQVGREVRSEPALAGTPLLFVSGRDGDRLHDLLSQLAPCAFLPKPLDLDDLLAAVQSLLG